MNHFECPQKDLPFSIDVIPLQNEEGILIKCNISDENIYLSVFNLEKLKNIDKLFGGYPPPPLFEVNRLLCKYFKENKVSIIEVSNSKIIIEIEKDVKPNMKFELRKNQNIFMNINNNNKEKNYNQVLVNNNMNYNENMNNIKMNYNINMNNNNMNYNFNMSNYINNNYKNNLNYNGNNNKNNYYGNMNNNYNNNINLNGNNNYNDNMNNNMNYIGNNNNYNNNNLNYNGNNNYNDGMNMNENMNNNSNYYMNLNGKMNNNINYNENAKNNNINYNENNNNNNNYDKNIKNICYYNNYNNIDNNKNNIYKNNNELLNNMVNKDMKRLANNENYGGVENKNSSINNSLNKDNIFSSQKSINSNESNFNILNEKQNQINSSLYIRVARPNNNYVDGPLKNLNCLLKFLLLKKITNKIESISNNKNLISKDVEEVLKLFTNINDSKHYKNKTNILEYLKYLNNKDLDFNILIENLFKEKQEEKYEIINYWKYLSKYADWNKDFGNKFFDDLKNCYFEYSIINMDILERNNPEEYEYKKKECKNMEKMILYILSEINPDSNKLNMELKYSNKSTYGKGFYFSDSIDYIVRCQNEENIPKFDENFYLSAFEIFYDKEKLEEFDKNLSFLDSNQNNISNEEEKVEPNGLKKIGNFYINENHNIKSLICTEYVLSEKYQILPLFTFTLRRNEYFVLYRDPNFIGQHNHSQYLNSLKLRSLKYSHNKNFYFESSTEEALKLLLKKKKEKVILITSIRYDKSGKRFVEIARKILNFDLIVLFFSNNTNHFNWVKDFSNCLYTNKSSLYEEYISNYHEEGLRELKKKVEELYSIELKEFTFDFMCYSNCCEDLSFSMIDYNNICPYFRSVNIINPNKILYLSMTIEGKVKKSEEECLWEVTIFDNTITFCSNGFYLDIDENKEIAVGAKEMKKWNFYIIDDCYYFINTDNDKNGILSIEDDDNISINKKDLSENSLFKLNDIIGH